MQIEPTLRDKFLKIFSEYYSDNLANRLATSHAEAHEQFLHTLGLARGGVRTKGHKVGEVPKKVVRVRRPAREKTGNMRRSIRRAANVDPNVIDEEIVSYLRSIGEPVIMGQIVDGCNGFGWTYAQVRVSVRRMCNKGTVVMLGNCRSAQYSLPELSDSKVGAEVCSEGLPAEDPADQ